jgi:hypothetical protein
MIAPRPIRLTVQAKTAQALIGTALSLVLASALLAVPSPARAADDDEPAWDTKILRGILEGIGLQRDEKVINYQERAPLVIPPSKTLPPPERSDAAIANNPAWPKDPDVLRAKEDAARDRVIVRAGESFDKESRPLRGNDMTPGAKPGTAKRVARSTQTAGSSSDSETNQRLAPSQLGYSGGLFGMFSSKDDESARFTGEPPRASLTEPPPGYQTPSPDQPYGMTDRSKAPKATNYSLERGTNTENK